MVSATGGHDVPSKQLDDVRAWQAKFGEANAAMAPEGVEAMRKLNHEWMTGRGEVPGDVRIARVELGGVPCEHLTVSGDSGPTFLFFHSGGFLLGSPEDDREWLARLVRLTGGEVFAPAYRLAPENAWPAQRNDALAVYRVLARTEDSRSNLIIMGESAGGFLAAKLIQAIAAERSEMPAAVVLLSPMLDLKLEGSTLDTVGDPFVVRPVLEMMIGAFLQGGDPGTETGLVSSMPSYPPTLIQVGTADSLLDDSRRFARTARDQEVDVTLETYDGCLHLWHGFPNLPESHSAIESIAKFAKRQARN